MNPDRPAYIEVYQREDELFDWRLVGGNHEVVCSSLQGFTSRGDAARGAEKAMDLMLMDPTLVQM